MATCAACLEPLGGGEKFVLAGTEVFHRECAKDIASSIGHRQKQEIVRLRGLLDRATADAEMATQRAQNFEGESRRALSDNRHLQLDLARSETNTRTLRHSVDRARDERDAAIEETRSLSVAVERQRRELALHAAMGPVPAPATATPDSKAATDTRDDTEIRFSLLEIDST